MGVSNRPMIEEGMKKKTRASSRTLGCLFWFALAVVLVAVALAVREPVLRNVRAVLGLGEPRVAAPDAGPAAGGSTGAAAPGHASPSAPSSGQHAPSAPMPSPSAAGTAAPASSAAPATPSASPASAPAVSPAAPATSTPPMRRRSARLWFAKVDDEGAIELAPVNRSLPAGDSPLRDNLVALLAGPTTGEARDGVVSFLPAGTVVRSVTVRGDIATIDFSEQFRFNTLGIDGLRAQLRQVVWAATEFPTVSRVQVLIEGKRVDYLAPEGAAVGSPLGRDSDFQ